MMYAWDFSGADRRLGNKVGWSRGWEAELAMVRIGMDGRLC